MVRRGRDVSLGFAVALATTLSGCSPELPKTAPVQGKVVFGTGKPLKNATVQFIPASGTAGSIANGTTDSDGRFELQTYIEARRVKLDGAVPGQYKVVVTPYPRGQRIAPKYGSPIDTPLTVEVSESGATNLTLKVAADS